MEGFATPLCLLACIDYERSAECGRDTLWPGLVGVSQCS